MAHENTKKGFPCWYFTSAFSVIWCWDKSCVVKLAANGYVTGQSGKGGCVKTLCLLLAQGTEISVWCGDHHATCVSAARLLPCWGTLKGFLAHWGEWHCLKMAAMSRLGNAVDKQNGAIWSSCLGSAFWGTCSHRPQHRWGSWMLI